MTMFKMNAWQQPSYVIQTTMTRAYEALIAINDRRERAENERENDERKAIKAQGAP